MALSFIKIENSAYLATTQQQKEKKKKIIDKQSDMKFNTKNRSVQKCVKIEFFHFCGVRMSYDDYLQSF